MHAKVCHPAMTVFVFWRQILSAITLALWQQFQERGIAEPIALLHAFMKACDPRSCRTGALVVIGIAPEETQRQCPPALPLVRRRAPVQRGRMEENNVAGRNRPRQNFVAFTSRFDIGKAR